MSTTPRRTEDQIEQAREAIQDFPWEIYGFTGMAEVNPDFAHALADKVVRRLVIESRFDSIETSLSLLCDAVQESFNIPTTAKTTA